MHMYMYTHAHTHNERDKQPDGSVCVYSIDRPLHTELKANYPRYFGFYPDGMVARIVDYPPVVFDVVVDFVVAPHEWRPHPVESPVAWAVNDVISPI